MGAVVHTVGIIKFMHPLLFSGIVCDSTGKVSMHVADSCLGTAHSCWHGVTAHFCWYCSGHYSDMVYVGNHDISVSTYILQRVILSFRRAQESSADLAVDNGVVYVCVITCQYY